MPPGISVGVWQQFSQMLHIISVLALETATALARPKKTESCKTGLGCRDTRPCTWCQGWVGARGGSVGSSAEAFLGSPLLFLVLVGSATYGSWCSLSSSFSPQSFRALCLRDGLLESKEQSGAILCLLTPTSGTESNVWGRPRLLRLLWLSNLASPDNVGTHRCSDST